MFYRPVFSCTERLFVSLLVCSFVRFVSLSSTRHGKKSSPMRNGTQHAASCWKTQRRGERGRRGAGGWGGFRWPACLSREFIFISWLVVRPYSRPGILGSGVLILLLIRSLRASVSARTGEQYQYTTAYTIPSHLWPMYNFKTGLFLPSAFSPCGKYDSKMNFLSSFNQRASGVVT